MPFNPDAYLAEKTASPEAVAPAPSAPSGGFDPDAYLGASESKPSSVFSKDMVSQLADKLRSTGQDLGVSLNDLGLGTVQGATLGFADELEGGAKAAVDAAQTGKAINPLNEEFMKKYREFQQGASKKYKEADERSPWLYGSGNIVGGVATAPLMGAAGLATTGGRAAVGAAMAEGGLTAAAKRALLEAGKDAVVAAPAGALMGAGSSEGGLESPAMREKLKDDTIRGGEMGGLIGGGVGLASAVLPNVASSAGNAIKDKIDDMDSPFSRLLKKSYGAGKEGVDLTDEVTQNKLFGKSRESAGDLNDAFDKADDMYGGNIGKLIKDADSSGVQIDLEEPLQKAFAGIEKYSIDNPSIQFTPKTQKLIETLAKNGRAMTPEEANMLNRELQKVGKNLSQDMTVPQAVKEQIYGLQAGVKSAMNESIPGLKDANKQFANFRGSTYEQVLAGHKDPEVSNLQFGGLKNRDAKFQDKAESLINGATSDGSGAWESRAGFEKLKAKLLDLQKTQPEAFAAMGTDAPAMISAIRDSADMDTMIKTMARVNPKESMGIMKSIMGVAGVDKAGGLKMANKAGLYGDRIVNAVSAPARMTKKAFFDLPLESMGAVANHLSSSSSQNVKNLGEALQKAVANKDQVAKNAVLFSIMQNPNTRKMFDLDDAK